MVIWKRMDSESVQAYRAFRLYRDYGAQRSIVKAIEAGGGRPAANRRYWQHWSAKWSWVKRCEAFDAYMEAIELRAFERERVRMAIRHAKIAKEVQEKALNRLSRIEDELTPKEVLAYLEAGIRIERQARGESTESIGIATMTNEQRLVRIKQLLTIARARMAAENNK